MDLLNAIGYFHWFQHWQAGAPLGKKWSHDYGEPFGWFQEGGPGAFS